MSQSTNNANASNNMNASMNRNVVPGTNNSGSGPGAGAIGSNGLPLNPQEPQTGDLTPLSSLSGMSYPMGISSLPMNPMIDEKVPGPKPSAKPEDNPKDTDSTGRPISTTRRAAQNRSAQKAFRQRRERYIKDIETQAGEVPQLKQTIEDLKVENSRLRDYTIALQGRLIELGSDPSYVTKTETDPRIQ